MCARLIGRMPGRGPGQVLVEPEVMTVLGRFRQMHHDAPEAGGILLGYRRGHHLHAIEATEPAPTDGGSRFHFHRSASAHQHIATNRWRHSGGTLTYLGEWHTHPELVPHPSSLDLASWRELCERHRAPLLFLIAGTGADGWVGVGSHRLLRPVRMLPVPGEGG